MSVRVHMKLNRIDAITRQVRQAAGDELVLSVARDIADGARRRSRRRTGFLAGSWQAEKTRPDGATAYSDANTAHLHEYGTVHMSAQPMATPAAESERAKLGRRAQQVIRRAAR